MKPFLPTPAALICVACLCANPALATKWWDPDVNSGNNNFTTGAGLGGTANWANLSGTPWWNGSTHVQWDNSNSGFTTDEVVLWGTAGTLTLGSGRTVGAIRFRTTGYTITGSTVTMGATGAHTITVDTGTSTIASILAGSSGYTVTGGGTLLLNNTGNSISGATLINGGSTLRLSDRTDLGANSASQTLTLDNGVIRNDDTTANAEFLVTTLGTVTLNAGGGSFNVPVSSTTLQLTHVVTGDGALGKSGQGVLVLIGANTFTGGIKVDSGVLSFNGEATSTVGAATPTGAIPSSTTPAYATLNGGTLRSTRTGVGVTFLDSRKGITLNGGGILEVADATAGNLNIYSGVVTGTGPLTKGGAGVLSLTAAQTYSGATSITAGTLRLRTNPNLIPNSSAVTISSGATFDLATFSETVGSIAGAGAITGTSTAATLTVGGDDTSTTFSGQISGSGLAVIKTGLGTMTISGNDWANGGTITISAGIIKFGNSAAGFSASSAVSISSGAQLDMNGINDTFGNLGGAGDIINGANISVGGNTATATFSGSYNGSGTFTKTGSGTQTLSGVNSFSALNFNDGRINFNNDSAAGSGIITVGSGADEFVVSSGAVVLANDITLSSGGNVNIYATSGNSLEQTGIIGGAGGLLRDDDGSGTLKLSGANTYAGGFKITSRAVRLNHKQAVGQGTFTIGDSVTAPANAITLNADMALTGANALANTVVWNQNFTLAAVNDLELAGGVTVSGSRTATVNSGVTLTLSGTVGGGSGGITKTGTGTLTLSGNNGYGGNTIVSAGTLLVNNISGSGSGSGTVNVNGGTLGGNGTISGAVTINSGGTLAPGTSIGTLTLDAAPSLGGTLAMEINATDLTSDKLNLTSGTFTYGGTLALTVTAGTLVGGEVFNLFDFTGTSSGSFTITTSPSLGAGLNWWQGNLASTGELILNRAPTGGSDSLSTATNTPASITVNKLKNFHPDADGNTTTFALVSGTTTQGGTVGESAGTVTYTPPSATFGGADSFDYTLDDGRGGITTIAVNVTVGAGTAQGANSVLVFTDTAPAPDQFVARFAGVPGVIYTVEHSAAATGPWSKLENKTAPTDNSLGFGIGVFEIRENIDASDAGFYRTVHPSY